jgi:DNA modification methylase
MNKVDSMANAPAIRRRHVARPDAAVKTSEKPPINLEALHRFHSYCARFPSRVAEAAINQYSRIGDSVLDPFCGSGTSMVAGLFQGRSVVGTDIDVLAGMLSEVKCAPRSWVEYNRWRSRFGAKLLRIFTSIESKWTGSISTRPGESLTIGTGTFTLPLFPELNYWFPPQLTAGLAAIAAAAHECRDSHYEKVALVSLSASIIAKWPNTLSYAMDIDHTRPHRRVQRFRLARILDTYLSRLDRTIDCLAALHKAYTNAGVAGNFTAEARIICPHDARTPFPDIAEETQSLVVTSPPYFNAVDYPRAHRMSVCWMNGHAPSDLASRQDYIGLHRAKRFDSTAWLNAHPGVRKLIPSRIAEDTVLERQLTGFFADLEAVLVQIQRVLNPGGHAVFVIGDNVVKGQRVASHAALVDVSRTLGFTKRDARLREITTLRRRYPVGPFGFDGPMTHEFVVVLQKPPTKLRVRRKRDE